MSARLAVVISTRNRVALLPGLLESIEVARAQLAETADIVVIDNGSTDETEAWLARWSAAAPGRTHLLIAGTGKSGALNTYLRQSAAELLVFTDDDVLVDAAWLAAIERFCRDWPQFDAGAGPIRVPRQVTDQALLDRIRLYPTLPYWESDPGVHDVTQLLGANMVLRRRVFEKVGFFDERLGVGAIGSGEETELCDRMIAAGLRVAYMPEAVVYHLVDESRLNLEALCTHERRVARSKFLIRAGGDSTLRLLLHLVETSLVAALAVVRRDHRRAVKNRGKMAFYAEMLRLKRGA